MQKFRETPARNFTYKGPQQNISRVAVGPFRSGSKFRALLLLEKFEHSAVMDLYLLNRNRGIGRGHQVFVILQPGSVVEQIANGDLPAVFGKIRKNLSHAIVIT